jgi:hypothetical protein
MPSTEETDARTKAERAKLLEKLEKDRAAAEAQADEAAEAGVSEDELAAIRATMARAWPLGL